MPGSARGPMRQAAALGGNRQILANQQGYGQAGSTAAMYTLIFAIGSFLVQPPAAPA